MSARIAVVILILLLLPIVFGPIVIGLLIERGLEEVLAATESAPVEVEFDRGLYTSRARTRVARSDGGGAVLEAEHVIVHGPIPLAAPAIGRSPLDLVIAIVHSRVEADAEAMPNVAAALGDAALATVVTRVTAVGDIDSSIDSPGFEVDGGRLIWGGLVGGITLRESGRFLAGELATEGLRVADAESSLTVEPATGSFDVDLYAKRLEARFEQAGTEWVAGDRRFRTGPIRIEGDQPIGGDVLGDARSVWMISELAGGGGLGEGDFEMRGLKIEQTLERAPESGLLRAEIGLAFDAWQVGAAPPDGPGGLIVALERVDRAAVERLREALQEVERTASSPEEAEAMRPFVVLDQLPGLLATSPVFAVRDAFVEGPEGRLEAALHVTVDGSQPELLSDPFMMMALVDARASMQGPEPLVRRMTERLLPAVQTAPPVVATPPDGAVVSAPVPEPPAPHGPGEPDEADDRVDAWLRAGTLVRDGDELRFEARFEDGVPWVNGAPADPAFVSGLVPGM